MIAAAFDITIIGMGFVIIFLILFSLATKAMSFLVERALKRATNANTNEISEEAQFVIKDAIKQHINNV